MHDASLRKNTEPRCMFPAKTEPWGSKNRGSCLERQKCLRCGAEKNRRCRGVSKVPALNTTMLPIFFLSNGCHVESKREVVVSLTCFAAFPDYQFCSHWLKACQMREKPGAGFKSHAERKVIVFNCSS